MNKQGNSKVADPEFKCLEPGCGEVCKDKRSLGMHRWFKHHIRGVSYRGVNTARKAVGRPKGSGIQKGLAMPATSQVIPPFLAVRTTSVPAISAELVGYALGKIESLAEQIAHDNEVPTREFVGRIMTYYAEMARR
jgi:hypothetical protein